MMRENEEGEAKLMSWCGENGLEGMVRVSWDL